MMYPLGTVTSLSDSNLTVNSTNGFFLILEEDNEIIINGETVKVNKVYSDNKFSVKTSLTGYTSGEFVYANDKCLYLKYNLWKVESAINNYNLKYAGIKKLESDDEKIEYMDTSTTLDELEKMRVSLQKQLDDCLAESGEPPFESSDWVQRRLEYGTL